MGVSRRLNDSTTLAAVLALLGATAYRLPELRNPGVVNSDSAIVGLQAMHILRGQWHWFLWGSGYQTTADSVVAAAIFWFTGATPLALMLTALLGHLGATLFALLTLRRRFSAWVSLLLVMPLVVSPAPTHTYTLHPPRQTALTLVFMAIWLLDGAASARRETTRFAIGAGIGALACFADPYALVFAPGVALLALLSAFDGTPSRGHALRRGIAAVAGASVGAIPYAVGRLLPGAEHGPLTLTSHLLTRNWALLKGPCLSSVLGTSVLHQPGGAGKYQLWHAPLAFQVCQWLSAAVFALTLLLAIAAAPRSKIPWEIRRLGLMAALTVLVTVVGFLLSVMPMDHFASRYLVSLILVLPYLLATTAWLIRPVHLLALVAPLLASYAVSGWLGYEPFVRGFRIVDADWEFNETQLLSELSRRGISHAMADYWAAYRLTFLWKEGVEVVPVHGSQDRYAPYRQAFFKANRIAYIYDHRRSEESPQTVQSRVAQGCEEQFSVGGFDVYVLEREKSWLVRGAL
jgi:hypothetical protein